MQEVKKMLRCTVCGYITDEPVEKCPKCGADKTMFEQLEESKKNIILKSRRTNHIHEEITTLMARTNKLAEEGTKENLDANCVKIFNRIKKDAYETIQMIKAELAAHVAKEKWG